MTVEFARGVRPRLSLHAVVRARQTKENTMNVRASVEMQVDNEAAHGAFVPGKKYYVDFTPCD